MVRFGGLDLRSYRFMRKISFAGQSSGQIDKSCKTCMIFSILSCYTHSFRLLSMGGFYFCHHYSVFLYFPLDKGVVPLAFLVEFLIILGNSLK